MEMNELILQVADVIDQRGLARHKLSEVDGSVCIMGGFYLVTVGTTHQSIIRAFRQIPEHRELRLAFIKALGFTTVGEATHWNDDLNITKDDVIERLRERAGEPVLA